MIRLQLVLLVLVALLAPAAHGEAASSFPRDFTALGAASIFVATTPGHAEPTPDHTTLWRTDGSAEGTSELLLCSPACDPRPAIVASSGALALVTAHDETGSWQLWSTDGSQAGTRRLTAVPFLGPPPERHSVGWAAGLGRFFFAAQEPQGWGVWASDGTAAGTARVVALPPTVETAPHGFVEHEGAVYFFLPNAVPVLGFTELWRTGGTPATTARVAVIDAHVTPWTSAPPVSVGEKLVFVAGDGGRRTTRPWVTDGTAEGTRRLMALHGGLDTTPRLTAIGDRGWFFGADLGGRQFWVTDGSTPGTIRLLAVPHRSDFADGAWDPFPWRGGVALGAEGNDGLRLWASDGTHDGTRRLCHDACLLNARLVAATADRLYFVPADGTLWETDGTSAGTRQAAAVLVSLVPRESPPVVVAGDRLFFRGVESPGHVEQLWALERPTGELRRLTSFIYPQGLGVEWETGVLGGDRLLFSIEDGANGVEPWVSDGTPAGTHRLGNLAVGDDRGSCSPHETALCLDGNRFRVEVEWDDPHNGGSGPGRAIPAAGSDASGTFWFFSPDNVELIVKVLDGTPVNGHYWTFYGALTDVEYEITVTDTWTGATASYHNPPGTICGGGDTASLPGGGAAARTGASGFLRRVSIPAPPAPGGVDRAVAAGGPGPAPPRCVPDAQTLCFYFRQFRVRVEWHDQHNGGSGTGGALPFTDTSGFFWFFSPDNVELVVKLIDAFRVDGDFWFFYGALTDVGYTITVEDLGRGLVKRYVNPPGEICGRADTDAFPG
ncbi:MAG TPA: hypothetical protein VF100_03365 [Thermoanaerobaculia bacterium]